MAPEAGQGMGAGMAPPALRWDKPSFPKWGPRHPGPYLPFSNTLPIVRDCTLTSGGRLQIPRSVSGSEMAKDEEAENLLPGETEIQADTLGRTLLMRITLSHDCDCS